MPYVPKLRHLVKMVFRRRDRRAAEGLWYEGTWLSDCGDDEGARLAFSHARMLDPSFGGAFYNYAALTEKLKGKCPETLRAWEEYLAVAEEDTRQPRSTVGKVREHLEELHQELGGSESGKT